MDHLRNAGLAIFMSGILAPSLLADDWFSPTTVSVRITVPPHRDFSSTSIEVAGNGDSRIQTSTFVSGKVSSGTLLVISGNYLLVKGVELKTGAEIDALDAPALEVQTVLKLLAHAVPEGPASIAGIRAIDVKEQTRAIEIATQSASGGYPAPWSLTGSVRRDSGSVLSFAVTFKFAGGTDALTMTGDWQKSSTPSQFTDSLSVAGWRAFHLGPQQSTQGGSTILDYGAQEIPGGFTTLGQVRAYAKRKKGAS